MTAMPGGVGRRSVLAALTVPPLAKPGLLRAQGRIVINYGDHNAPDSVLANAVVRLRDLVAQRSGGRIEIRHFPGGQMGSQRDLLEQVKLGTLQMCYGDPPLLSNLLPVIAVMDLPFIFPDWGAVERAADGAAMVRMNELLVRQHGMRALGWFHIGFRHMMTLDRPLRTIADFRNVKMRSPESRVFIDMFRALGATPVAIPWPEVYTAMRTRVVDGMETTPEGMVNSRVFEVGRHVTETRHINTVGSPMVNDRFWNGMPAADRALIQAAVEEVKAWQRRAMIEANDAAFEQLRRAGVTIHETDRAALAEACRPVWASFAQRTPGAEDLVNDIRRTAQG